MTLRGLVDPADLVTADLRRGTEVIGPGGQPRRTLATYPVNVSDAKVVVSKLSGGSAERAFGRDSDAGFEVTLDRAVDLLVSDIVEVKTGRYAGFFLDVLDVLLPKRVKLAAAKETVLT